MPRIAIVDYGVGNIHSIQRALVQCGAEPFLTEDAEQIRHADAVVLPGVGAFAAGMQGLERRGLHAVLLEVAAAGTPLLGICLGAQLLLTEGHEFGTFSGLNLISGMVERMAPLSAGAKIPQIGWNTIAPPSGRLWVGSPLQAIIPGDHVYFVHSYVMRPTDAQTVLAETTYGGLTFCAAVQQGNIVGCQFHPEKSGEVGLRILRAFVERAAIV